MKWLQSGCVVLLLFPFTLTPLPDSGLFCLELTINGNFEQPSTAGWTEQIAATNYLIERGVFYDPDPDYEQYLFLGTGGGFLELYQTMLIPSTDIEFSVKAKLFAIDDSPGAWAGAAVIISYLERDGATLGTTYIASRSSQCPWEGTSTTHVIDVNDSLWYSYAFNISDELANLPGVDPTKIKRIRIAMYNEAHHCWGANETAKAFADDFSLNFTSSAPAVIHSSEDVAETSGNSNGLIEPGEVFTLTTTLRNFGATAYNVSAKLISDNGNVTVIDSASQFFDIATGDSADNASNPFAIKVDSVTPPGSTLDFLLVMYSSATYCDTSQFSLFVEDEHHESDDEPEIGYAISQNYPNPFTSTTIITYSLPQSGPVRISLYTVSGRWVKTLVNQIQDPGQHSLTFSGYGLKPGVYIIRLDTPSKSLTRACTIIR